MLFGKLSCLAKRFGHQNCLGTSGMDYHRHFREETKHPNLPIWSTHPEEKTSSLHSSLESSYKM